MGRIAGLRGGRARDSLGAVKIAYPEELPVSQRREAIREAVGEHPVVIVCGETGSGKTTQLPKIALELGRGEKARIGCTQPRRIAATSVARRVADEMQVGIGREVGYQIRFDDRTDREATRVKFMTGGILLAETRHDPELRQYDTVIVDEAHERSLEIDFTLGYLRRLQAKRRDLKVVISSATLDAEAFADFFGGAPVVEVEGRAYPVEDWWRPPEDESEPLAERVARAVEELGGEDRFGDTLVFLPGEREIRDAADLLEGRRYPDTRVLPLFGRQAAQDQEAVFNPTRTERRVILATNVAETSLTIPGIRFVVDTGIARLSRYDPGSGIQRLRIEPISQASARQRRGRCGRVAEGICVRLYDEEDFEERPAYTDPEILRSNLAGVVLQMEHLGLGDPLKFPFIDPPQPKRIAQAYRVLEEIGAVRKKGKKITLTDTGEALARLPLDPRIGRILAGARDEGCLREGLVVASALAVQDPRERPQDKQQAADEAHGRFRDRRSDFTGWLRWWHAIRGARGKSNNELRRFCRTHFLNYRRVREWLNLHRELSDVLKGMKWKLPKSLRDLDDPADTYSEPLHRAILAAIPSHIGLRHERKRGYRGARNTTFFLFPGSGLFGESPSWVMAFEMVETAKLYARNAASFDPAWMERVAPHLCRRRHSNPQWSPEQGAVYGEETVIAFGLPVVEKRRIHYARVDRARAREIFLLEALVNGNTRAPLPSLQRNRETLAAAERLEDKLRRRGGLVHPEGIVAFYEERIPADVCTQKDFERWIAERPEGAIDFALEDCLVPQTEPIELDDFPDAIDSPDGESSFDLVYRHYPGDPDDGITVLVPLAELPHLPAWFGEWLAPGWLPEKVASLLRCLGKDLRSLLPANREVVEGFLADWEGYEPQCGLFEALIEYLHDHHGLEVGAESFDLSRLPTHLWMNFRVVDDAGEPLAEGRDLVGLQERLADRVKDRFAEVAKGRFERERLGSWSFGDLPDAVELDRHTEGYPRLFDPGGEHAAMRLFPARHCAEFQHRLGVAKLYRASRGERVKRLTDAIFSPPSGQPAPAPKSRKKAGGGGSGLNSLAAAFGDADAAGRGRTQPAAVASKPREKSPGFLSASAVWVLTTAGPEPGRNREDLLRRILVECLGAPRTAGAWESAAAQTDERLFETAEAVCETAGKLLETVERVVGMLDDPDAAYAESIEDARAHLDRLLAPGWLLRGSLTHRLVHAQGLETRLTRMRGAPPVKDQQKMERYAEAVARSDEAGGSGRCGCGLCPDAVDRAEADEMDFDLRLQVFAPELRKRLKGG